MKNKMTNADKIRSMNNSQLFEFLNKRGFCPYTDGCRRGDQSCNKCLESYLERIVAPPVGKDS